MSGLRSYLAGHAAEDQVAQTYVRAGYVISARCWRGQSGEIDLIARSSDAVIFVEVKQARNHARAAESLSSRQIGRIIATATEFLAREPLGQMTECRFDLALVDQVGQIEIVENAFSA